MPPDSWNAYEPRIAGSLTRLLDLMERHGVRATGFVLGKVAEEHPGLVKEIARRGHEIGCHGYDHSLVYRQTPSEFSADLRRALDLLEDLIGKKVLGYRAPYFSITKRSLWALDILAAAGIRYDSSIFPIARGRYGIPDVPTPSG